MLLQLLTIIMNKFSLIVLVVVSLNITIACSQNSDGKLESNKNNSKNFAIMKTEGEWKKQLTSEQYEVIRKQGTERAFSGKYNNFKKKGTYHCAACGNPVFSSETKFDSGTGWPSFYAPISEENVGTEVDRKFGMTRTEVHCNTCGGHLGHVFDDGPKPTGLRYCLNSVSLDFKDNK